MLRRRGCRVNVADVKVCIEDGGAFFYPDLLVSCHPQDLTALKFDQHPTVIVEVLSHAPLTRPLHLKQAKQFVVAVGDHLPPRLPHRRWPAV